MTGLSSLMAAFSSPFASAGVDGTATSSPGTCRNHPSNECECVGPSWCPAPPGIRITIGHDTWPPNMYLTAAAWLTIWSIASSEKLTVMISTTGRSPAIAAPTPAPTIVFSEIGVSRTRFSPKSSSSPWVTLKAPWKTPMSSPIRNTDSSASISSRSAWFSASR